MLPVGSPHPYIPATEADRERMLARVGVESVDALFADLPAAYRDPAFELPPQLTEPELIALLEERAAMNADPGRPMFLGAGAYRRSIPSIAGYLTSRSEFVHGVHAVTSRRSAKARSSPASSTSPSSAS